MKYMKTKLYKYPDEYICTIKRIKKDCMQIVHQNNEYTTKDEYRKRIGVLVLEYSKDSKMQKNIFIDSETCPELDEESEDSIILFLRGSNSLMDIERLLFNKRKNIVNSIE